MVFIWGGSQHVDTLYCTRTWVDYSRDAFGLLFSDPIAIGIGFGFGFGIKRASEASIPIPIPIPIAIAIPIAIPIILRGTQGSPEKKTVSVNHIYHPFTLMKIYAN